MLRPATLPPANFVDSNAASFAALLETSVGGHALWAPSRDVGRVGDCGFINGGRFVKLYNVFDENEIQTITERDVETERKSNPGGPFVSSRIRKLEISASSDKGPQYANRSIETEVRDGPDDKIAFLSFRGLEHSDTIYKKTKLLETYLEANGQKIVKKYSAQYEIELTQVVIVYHSLAVDSWLGGISSVVSKEPAPATSTSGTNSHNERWELTSSSEETSSSGGRDTTVSGADDTTGSEGQDTSPLKFPIVIRFVRCPARQPLIRTVRDRISSVFAAAKTSNPSSDGTGEAKDAPKDAASRSTNHGPSDEGGQ